MNKNMRTLILSIVGIIALGVAGLATGWQFGHGQGYTEGYSMGYKAGKEEAALEPAFTVIEARQDGWLENKQDGYRCDLYEVTLEDRMGMSFCLSLPLVKFAAMGVDTGQILAMSTL